MRHLLILLLTTSASLLLGQHLLPTEAHVQGLSVYSDQGIMGLFANQAGLHDMEELTFSASAQRRYFTEGVNEFLLGAAMPLGKHTGGGLYLRSFGDDVYNETTLGLAMGRRLTERIALGVGLEGYRVGIEGYGDDYQIHAQVGLQGYVSEDVIVSSHAYIATGDADEQSYTTQSELNFDVAVHAGKKVWLKGGLRKRADDEFGVKFGLNYVVSNDLSIHVGVLTYPLQIGTGIGLKITDQLSGHIGGFWQPDLGWSSGITLTYAP